MNRIFPHFILGLLFLLSTAISGFSQRILPQKWLNENNIKDNVFSVGDQARLFGLGKVENIEKENYWNFEFQKALVYFYPHHIKSVSGESLKLDSLSGVKTRIDLVNHRLEFETETEIKIIEIDKVSNVFMMEENGAVSQFINGKNVGLTSGIELYEVLKAENQEAFLMSKELIVQSANYNAALDTGSKENLIVKKNHFFFWDGKSLSAIDDKKEVSQLLESVGIEAKSYFKNSKNRLSDGSDYINLAAFYFAQKQ